MRIYLAARYSRREEMVTIALRLTALGHEVTSRWIHGSHEIDELGLSREADRHERQRLAMEDLNDLLRADWCISFTEEPRSTPGRGGRHVEFGIALVSGLRMILVGPRENVFHVLPQVEHYATTEEMIEALGWNRRLGRIRRGTSPHTAHWIGEI